MSDLKKNPLAGLTIEQYSSQLRSGLLSAEETTCAFLDRIAQLDRKLGAYTFVDRSGPENLNSAISGNSGHNGGPRSVWR